MDTGYNRTFISRLNHASYQLLSTPEFLRSESTNNKIEKTSRFIDFRSTNNGNKTFHYTRVFNNLFRMLYLSPRGAGILFSALYYRVIFSDRFRDLTNVLALDFIRKMEIVFILWPLLRYNSSFFH